MRRAISDEVKRVCPPILVDVASWLESEKGRRLMAEIEVL
jgi:hypothetical protein